MRERNSCYRTLRYKYGSFITASIVAAFGLLAVPGSSMGSSADGITDFNRDMLVAVAELYDISEDQAVDRLARESEAAMVFKKLKDLSIDSYAGSWYDSSSMKLKVAIANPEDLAYLEMYDVEPVFVSKSLIELQSELRQTTNRLSDSHGLGSSVIQSFIDVRRNTVVLVIDKSYSNSVRSELESAGLSDLITIEDAKSLPQLSQLTIRGGDGTQDMSFGAYAPCSAGVSIEDGFITAGHCTITGHNISDDPGGTPLGVTQDSTWDWGNPSTDVAHVETFAGWTPSSQINGYTNGNFSVSAEWGGMVQYPIGSTVCRYGQTSGGPHCGTVDQFDVTVNYSGHLVTGLTQLIGSCSDDGDSGGPHVAGNGQVQGINSGISWFNGLVGCPNQAAFVWFQPVQDAIDAFNVTMLTAHGANPPTFTSAECPDIGDSSYGFFICRFDTVESQGEVTNVLWTSSNGGSSTKTWLKKRCIPPMSISVTLKATNPYGTTTNNYTFPCPQ